MAGTVTSILEDLGPNAKMVKLTYTADASDGSVPTFDFTEYANALYGWGLYMVLHDPGGTALTNLSTFTLAGLTTGLDLLGGAGSATVLAAASMVLWAGGNGQNGLIPVVENLRATLTQAAAATNSATGSIYCFFVRL